MLQALVLISAFWAAERAQRELAEQSRETEQ